MSDRSLSSLPDPENRYVLADSPLASGVDGNVYIATDTTNSDKQVAIKIHRLNCDTDAGLREELRVYKTLGNHPNFPAFYGAYRRGEDVWFVLELCEGGSALDFVRGLQNKTRRMAEEHIAFILKEVVKALVHLHENHTIHRDVSAANILLTASGEVKLCDFNLSTYLGSTSGKSCECIGSVSWMAPEVVQVSQTNTSPDGGYGSRVDVWALGITAIELADGRTPYQDMHPTRAMFQIVRNPPPKLQRPSNWSETFNDFISECLEKNPEYRPYMVEIMEHPFLSSIPDNSYYLTQELKKIIDDLGLNAKSNRKPEYIIRSNLLKTSQNSEPERMFLEDLAAMDNLSEDLILFELQERMAQGHFHTFIGDILLILNPNEQQDIYGNSYHNKYHLKSQSENPPHIYSVADRAYQDALHHEIPQYILLSGESGSGKSVNRRHLLDHLVFMGRSGNKNGPLIEEATDMVDALTTASTPTNPSGSTRCVLKTEVTYGSSGKITGAVFNVFLLEKWRVSSTDMSQANFHALYYFYNAMNASGQLNLYFLDPGQKYRYLRVSGVKNLKEVRHNRKECVEKFNRLFKNSTILDQQQLDVIFKIFSAILNLGEICFVENDAGFADIENPEYCTRVSEMLSIENKRFSWALTNYCLVDKGTAIRKYNTPDQARDARDMLACCLYARLVDWIVNIINYKLSTCRAIYGEKYFIHVLDMFGFECHERNDLEQLLVNGLNEQMQYHYTQRVFAWEQLELAEEEVPPLHLNYYDNKLTMDQLLSKPTGVLALIDDCSRTGHSHQHILEKLSKSSNAVYVAPVSAREFSVAHYTGKVTYEVRAMPHKNRDFLPPETVETLRMSTSQPLRDLFASKLNKMGNLVLDLDTVKDTGGSKWSSALVAEKEKTNKGKLCEYFSQTRRMRTAISTYRACALELLRELSVGGGAGGTWFVRCARTDLGGRPRHFHQELVKHQLRAMAILDTAIARQRGYPHRIVFQEFLRRYKFLAFDYEENVEMTRDNCRLLLVRLKMEGWLIGKTKVFLTYYNEEYLARLYETQVKKIVKVQSMMRAFLAKRNFTSKLKILKEKKEGPKLIRQQSDLGNEAAAAIMIQRVYRGHVSRKKYGPIISKDSGQVDKETVEFIRPFAKKWRNKSIFQVLLQYRSAKYQDFVNFAQQIHIFNQNAFHESQKLNYEIDSNKIDTSARRDVWIGQEKQSVWKMPFTFDELPYYETAAMCQPNSIAIDEEHDTWDKPLKWRESHLKEKKENDYNTTRCKSPVYQKQKITEQHIITVPYNRDPTSTIKKLPSLEPEKIRSRTSSQTMVKDTAYSKNEITLSSPNESFNKTYPPKISSPKHMDRNFEGANQDFEFIRSPLLPQCKLRKTGNPIAELETKGKKTLDRVNDDDPPFNFQGMLRKTNFKRDSMKKIDENDEAPYKNILKQKNQRTVIFENEKCKKTRYQVQPGVFLEGTEELV